jgi:alanyl-tRNA synthetase
MQSSEIRAKFLEFFKSKGHTVIPSASLIPENDPTVLFTTAGMHPLVPYLMGEVHPGGKRLTDVQKCIRTGDIDEVGDPTHLTFFEMLGNWSLGEYFKEDAIKWSYEFLTSPQWLGLDKNLLAVSVFQGDQDAPLDEEAFNIWKSLGIAEKRIAKLPKKNNWWGPAGETGPCGPDTEMFYWTGNPEEVPESFNDDNPLWVEIWNDVFMQYNKRADGTFEPLVQKNVDTGMGLERTVAILNKTDVYLTDSFKSIIEEIERLSGKKYLPPACAGMAQAGGADEVTTKSMRIVADHLRAAVFILGDERGVVPTNAGQGYVLRRLIRRAVRHGKLLGIKDNFASSVANKIINNFKNIYAELSKNSEKIITELSAEENKFATALDKGLKEFSRLTEVDGKVAFDLYQSYGFPLELTEELSRERGFKVDKEVFSAEFKKHQDLSRTASAGQFKGGLAGTSEQEVKLHTATHLLHKALIDVLGIPADQKGSNITPERLRFDFECPRKVTPEELIKIEKIVNQKIKEDLPVHFEVLSVEEAKAKGAIGIFEDKYAALGGNIKVYFVGDYSKEICGGPHVEHTGVIGKFKIQKEEAVAAGVRRIKAVIE